MDNLLSSFTKKNIKKINYKNIKRNLQKILKIK